MVFIFSFKNKYGIFKSAKWLQKVLNEMTECLFLHVFRVRCWVEPARLPTSHKMSPATLADFSRASSNQLLMITWPLPPTLVMMSSFPAHRNTPLSSQLSPGYPPKSILSSFFAISWFHQHFCCPIRTCLLHLLCFHWLTLNQWQGKFHLFYLQLRLWLADFDRIK